MASYNNCSLFSDYYIEELVDEDSHWQTLRTKAWEYRQRIVNILEKAVPGINGDTPEAEVERRLIRPVLDVLGHIYFANPAVHSPEGIRRPDYAFFSSAEARAEAESHKGQPEFFENALAVGDAKAWERSLDKRIKGPGDPFTNHNPSYQIDFYLRATNKKWGLVTNGRHWRLYHRDLSYRLDVYYEVDLTEIVGLDEEAFLYFLAFFHKESFEPDGTGESFLNRAYRASTEYAAKVSEELKDNIYEALRLLAEGLLSFTSNGLKPEDLNLIRENAFILIYRLLFILYAEARGFLPVANHTYFDTYSLRALTHEIATKEPFESKLSPATTVYWSRLQELFRLINNGDDFLGIPPYNGRLFDDQKEHQSLASWKIGDRYLAEAVDQLARAEAAGRTGRGFVSYKDLSIRELGSIYEGLLEHRLRYATEDVAVVKDDKREKFIPLAELGKRNSLKTYTAGSVYLETDKGERKATGSYYTPQQIVEYIVNNTLDPLLEDAKDSGVSLIDAILSMKVLDPAMGSGHFLVESTDYLARALVEALGVDIRETEEEEIRWARREVVERCIYGVDLNPLAVDLAKLSLWLSTVSLDKPLNYLDHHLRCGNSLTGARLDDLGILPETVKKGKKPTAITTLAGYKFQDVIASAVSTFHKIAETPSESVEDIHNKENAYETARHALSRIRSIGDVWTSVYFGNDVKDKDAYERLLSLADQDSTKWPELGELPWLDKAKDIAKERCFFHWELEFPEVFYDQIGQRLESPGFNVVAGNPPYERTKYLIEDQDAYNALFTSAYGAYDIYILFMEKSISLLNGRGHFGFITSNKYLVADYGLKFRQLIRDYNCVRELIDLTECPSTFPNVLVSPILTFVSSRPQEHVRIAVVKSDKLSLIESLKTAFELVDDSTFEDNDLALEIRPIHQLVDETSEQINLYLVGKKKLIVQKLYQVSDYLEYIAEIRTGIMGFEYWSIEPLVSDKASYSVDEIKLLPPSLISRHENLWGIEPVNIYNRRFNFPILHRREGIINQNTWDFFNQPKIVVRGVARRLSAVIDEEGHALLVAVHGIRPKEYSYSYVAALLNSKLLNWLHVGQFYGARIPQGSLRYPVSFYKRLPIRHISFATPKERRGRMVAEGNKLYEEFLQSKDWGKVLYFVDKRLPQKPDGSPDTEQEQSDVIHDLLAFMTDNITRLHKDKQTEVKGFLSWLEDYLGVSVEDLNNKTKIKEYWNKKVRLKGLIGALEQNRKTIQLTRGVDVTRREPQENIRAEYDASVAKLGPLLECIELTDKLIDQIVYKLYGLTEEEIAIVERQG